MDASTGVSIVEMSPEDRRTLDAARVMMESQLIQLDRRIRDLQAIKSRRDMIWRSCFSLRELVNIRGLPGDPLPTFGVDCPSLGKSPVPEVPNA